MLSIELELYLIQNILSKLIVYFKSLYDSSLQHVLNMFVLIMKSVLYKWLIFDPNKKCRSCILILWSFSRVSFYTSSFWLFDRTK